MKTIKLLLLKYKELLLYIVFGGGTTVVNFLVFALFQALLGERMYLFSNGLAWLAAVVFAYITNKLWVFESKSWQPKVLWREIPPFLGARVLSFTIEEVGLFVFLDLLKFNSFSLTLAGITLGGSLITKLILAVIVVMLNYFFSKLFIFKK